MSEPCNCEVIGRKTHVRTPLIHGDVTLTKREPKANPNPKGKCVIQDMMMALDATALELGMGTFPGTTLHHFCVLCGMYIEGGIQFEIPERGDFDSAQTDRWGSGWNTDNQ